MLCVIGGQITEMVKNWFQIEKEVPTFQQLQVDFLERVSES